MRVAFKILVHVGDLTIDRSVDIASNLDALHHCRRVISLELFIYTWKLEVGDLAELLLGIIGDADSGNFLLGDVLDPLVTFGEVLS